MPHFQIYIAVSILLFQGTVRLCYIAVNHEFVDCVRENDKIKTKVANYFLRRAGLCIQKSGGYLTRQ